MGEVRIGVWRRLQRLDVMFLVSAAIGVAIYIVVHRPPEGLWLLTPPQFAVGTALIVVGWFGLSWEREHRLGPRLYSALWAVVTFVGTIDALGAGTLCALAVANLVFVWGTAPAGAYVVLMVAGNVANTLHRGPLTPFGTGLMLYIVVTYTAVCVTADVVRRAREDKRRTESLLAQLEQAHDELSAQAEQIRELTVSAERARFARDMHDSVGHHLTAVTLTLRTALRAGADRADDAREHVTRALDMVKEALEETRRTVRALHPLALTDDPLDTVLDAMLQGFRSPDRHVSLRTQGCPGAVPPDVAAVVYRTAQEGMTNVVRHTDARTVEVTLAVGDDIELSITDDGTPSGSAQGEGSGLRGLRDRARQLGGTLDAHRRSGGFTLVLSLPAHAPAG